MQRRVLFFDPFGAWPVHNQVDGMLAKSLEVRGAAVTIVRCRGALRQYINGVLMQCGLSVSCEFCAQQGDMLFDNLRLPQVDLADYILKDDVEEASRWAAQVSLANYPELRFRDIPIGEWATPQLLSVFRIGLEDLALPKADFLGRGLLVGTFVAYIASKRLFDAWNPDAVVLFNGRFYPYRAAFHAAREKNKDVLVHERAWFGDGFVMYHNDTVPAVAPFDRMFAAWRDIPLTEEEIALTDSVLQNRRYGKDFTLPSFYELTPEQISAANVRRRLGIPEDVRLIGCFTSSHEESWHPSEPNPAVLQVEFLRNLFEVMRDRNEWLVVRNHPNITKSRVNTGPEERFMMSLFEEAAKASANVRVIQPDEQISSYQLFDTLDGAFSIFSSIGLELVTSGVPTVGYADIPHSRFPSLTLRDLGKAEIARALNALAGFTPETIGADIAHSYRYYYRVIIKHAYAFKTFRIAPRGDGWGHQITLTGIEDFLPGQDPMLDHVSDFLLGKSPLYHYPTLEDRRRQSDDERAFVARRVAENARRRDALARAPAVEVPPVVVFNLGGGPSAGGNRHSAVIFRDMPWPGDWSKAIATLGLDNEAGEFITVSRDNVNFDLTALTSGAEQLRAAPDAVIALTAAWKLTTTDATLTRLGIDVEEIRESHQRLDPADFLRDLLPRIVWRRSTFSLLQDWAHDGDAAILSDKLTDLVTSDSVLRIDRPRLMLS